MSDLIFRLQCLYPEIKLFLAPYHTNTLIKVLTSDKIPYHTNPTIPTPCSRFLPYLTAPKFWAHVIGSLLILPKRLLRCSFVCWLSIIYLWSNVLEKSKDKIMLRWMLCPLVAGKQIIEINRLGFILPGPSYFALLCSRYNNAIGKSGRNHQDLLTDRITHFMTSTIMSASTLPAKKQIFQIKWPSHHDPCPQKQSPKRCILASCGPNIWKL